MYSKAKSAKNLIFDILALFGSNIRNFQGVRPGGFRTDFRKNKICSVITTYRSNFLRTENNKKIINKK